MSEILENPSNKSKRHLRLVKSDQDDGAETETFLEQEKNVSFEIYDSLRAIGLHRVDTDRIVSRLLDDELSGVSLNEHTREERAHLLLNHLLVYTHTTPNLDAIRLQTEPGPRDVLEKALCMANLAKKADDFIELAINERRLVEILDPIFDELTAHDDSNIVLSVTSLESLSSNRLKEELPVIKRKLGAMFMIARQEQL